MSSVWEAISEPSSSAAGVDQLIENPTVDPSAIGIANVITPNMTTAAAVHSQQREVELDAGDEHQVQQPELAELGHGRVAGPDHVQAVGTDHEAADQQADDPGQPRALEQRRSDDHHQEQDQELPCRPGR